MSVFGRGYGLALAGLVLLVIGLGIAAQQYRAPTTADPATLIAFEGPLSAPVHRWFSRRTSYLAPVSLPGLTLRIQRICALWSCELPAEIRALRKGDIVAGQRIEDEIVELSQGDVLLLTRAQWQAARQAVRWRGIRTGLWIAGGGTVLLALSLWLGRRRRSMSASPARE